MRSGIINIVFGAIGVVLGLGLIPGAPRPSLIGTHSSEALAVVGGAIVALGVFQVWRDRRR